MLPTHTHKILARLILLPSSACRLSDHTTALTGTQDLAPPRSKSKLDISIAS